MGRTLVSLLAIGAAIAALSGAGAAQTKAGSVVLVDQSWTCNRALTSYGSLPIVVTLDYTQTNVTDFGARLGAGCVGDGDPSTVDLELHINGNGVQGPYDDAIRVMNASPGASNIVIAGEADCGRARQGAHQDGIQAIGGTNITFLDFKVGMCGQVNQPSCQGAGGALFYSGSNIAPVNMNVVGGQYRACNHGLIDGYGQAALPTGSITGARIENGYDASTSVCQDSAGRRFFVSATCDIRNPQVTESNIVCSKWPWRDIPPPEPPPPGLGG